MRPARIKYWSQWSDLNRRPTDYESVALPLSYIGRLGYIATSADAAFTTSDKVACWLQGCNVVFNSCV